MLVISALALLVASVQGAPIPAAAPEPLDSRWIPGTGTVQLSTPGGPRLTVEIRDPAGSSSLRNLELDLLAPDSVVVEARSSSFIANEGMVIGLAVRTGDTTSYHSLLIHRLADEPSNARTNAPGQPGDRRPWRLTKPIFTSTGERYRILDVHNPGGDSIEITFRRGYVDTRNGEPRLDEKIYVNVCPGSEEPFIPGSLLDVSTTRSPR